MAIRNFVFTLIIPGTCLVVCKQVLVLLRHTRCGVSATVIIGVDS